MKISDVLVKAKTLIQDPENWTQGVSARDNLYEPVPAMSRNAICFCTYGALTDKQIEAAVAMWFSEAPAHKNFNTRMRAAIDAAFKEKP